MKVEQNGHTTIIRDTKLDLPIFIDAITSQRLTLIKNNVIIDLHNYPELYVKDVLLFAEIAKDFKKNKKSLVIVACSTFDFNANTKKITVVPSLLEAHDIIEMEEIERDLGF